MDMKCTEAANADKLHDTLKSITQMVRMYKEFFFFFFEDKIEIPAKYFESHRNCKKKKKQ